MKLSELDYKIKEIFPAESVFKTPEDVSVFEGFNIPSFIKDWVRAKFSNEDGNINVYRLKSFMEKYFPRKGSEIKRELISGSGEVKILVRVVVTADLRTGKYKFAIPDLDIQFSNCFVRKSIIEKYPYLVDGETWGIVKLIYIQPTQAPNAMVEMVEFIPFQPYEVNVDYFRDCRKEFTLEEWIDVLLRSMEYNPDGFDSIGQKLLFLSRLLVFVEPNLNVIELAPKGTGKSYTYSNLSKYGWVFSGGTVTRAKLFYDIGRRSWGIITRCDFVVLDEIETINFGNDAELQGALKNYLEMGSFAIADVRKEATAGFVLLGNIPLSERGEPRDKHYLGHLPRFFHSSALLDRFHAFIKGWRLPRMREDMKLRGYALNVEFFSEVLHQLRNVGEFSAITESLLEIPHDADTRDTKAVRKLCSAYLKLLFPHIREPSDISKEDFERFCLRPAMEKRKIIREQLHYMDPEYSVEMPKIRVNLKLV